MTPEFRGWSGRGGRSGSELFLGCTACVGVCWVSVWGVRVIDLAYACVKCALMRMSKKSCIASPGQQKRFQIGHKTSEPLNL